MRSVGGGILSVTTIRCLGVAVQRLEQGPLLLTEPIQLPIRMEKLQLLLAEKSSHDRLLPLVPHLGVVGEELVEQLGRLFGLENKEDKDDHGCARAQGIFGQDRLVEDVVEQDFTLDLFLIQRGQPRVVDPRDAERRDEHDLPEEGPLGDEEELGNELDREEDGAPSDVAVVGLAGESERESAAGNGVHSSFRTLE